MRGVSTSSVKNKNHLYNGKYSSYWLHIIKFTSLFKLRENRHTYRHKLSRSATWCWSKDLTELGGGREKLTRLFTFYFYQYPSTVPWSNYKKDKYLQLHLPRNGKICLEASNNTSVGSWSPVATAGNFGVQAPKNVTVVNCPSSAWCSAILSGL